MSVEQLRDLLLRFECGVRKPVMGSVFWGTLGHTRLIRLTVEDRELKQMFDAKKKKLDRVNFFTDFSLKWRCLIFTSVLPFFFLAFLEFHLFDLLVLLFGIFSSHEWY